MHAVTSYATLKQTTRVQTFKNLEERTSVPLEMAPFQGVEELYTKINPLAACRSEGRLADYEHTHTHSHTHTHIGSGFRV